MRTHLLSAALATTIATGCLHPEPCPSRPGLDDIACEEQKEIDAAIGFALLVAGINLASAIAQSSSNKISVAPPPDLPTPAGRRARDHAAAGRCKDAVADYEILRLRSAAASTVLARDEKVAACLASEAARTRGAM